MPDAGTRITISDFAEALDNHEDRLVAQGASISHLAATVISYMGALALCKQAGQTIDTVDGDSRVQIAFHATMPSNPDVVVSLGDYTGPYFVGVIAASVTTSGCDVFVFNMDGSPATGDDVRINWNASCPFPDTGTITP